MVIDLKLYMPKLLINESNTFIFELKKYPIWELTNKDFYPWCSIRLSVHNTYMNFDWTDEYLEKIEVDYLIMWLRKLLNNEKVSETEITFIEPDLVFRAFLPFDETSCGKTFHYDLCLVIFINFKSSGIYRGEEWKVVLDREKINNIYLRLEKERFNFTSKLFENYH